jgi:DNA mismatch repair protein MutL
MVRIAVLPDHLITQIAAGEVVERPASVVKELVENALDAGARRVEVELAAGGRQRILVRDDGSGMSPQDLELAFTRHATSKIREFEDLERVATLGFRGEALAAVAAVSRLEARSAESDGAGARLRIEGGERLLLEPEGCRRGTSIEVENLFFNVPVRRKFLKQSAAELRRCIEVLQGYALARPEVGFTVSHEGRQLLRTDAVSNDVAGRLERIAQLFGVELSTHLVAISGRDGAISGFVGDSTTVGGRRLFVFVNRRLLRDRAVLAVFYRMVREAWGSDRFPALFLFLDLPPEEVDVNVHPQKSEVRFRNPHRLGQVGAALRRALDLARGEEAAVLKGASGRVLPPRSWEGLGEYGHLKGWAEDAVAGSPGAPGEAVVGDESGEVREAPLGSDAWQRGRDASGGGVSARLAETRYLSAAQRSSEHVGPGAVSALARGGEGRALRILGQYKGSLILLEGPDALYLVDQHAAHERVLFERLRRNLGEQRVVGQRLLEPLMLELSVVEAETLVAHAATLESLGFSLNTLSGGTTAVTTVPSSLDRTAARALLLSLASGSEREEGAEGNEGDEEGALRERILHEWAATRACRSAVRIHRVMTLPEMEQLISELFAAENPHACPHGRPTLLRMEDADLERRFGRRGQS